MLNLFSALPLKRLDISVSLQLGDIWLRGPEPDLEVCSSEVGFFSRLHSQRQSLWPRLTQIMYTKQMSGFSHQSSTETNEQEKERGGVWEWLCVCPFHMVSLSHVTLCHTLCAAFFYIFKLLNSYFCCCLVCHYQSEDNKCGLRNYITNQTKISHQSP